MFLHLELVFHFICVYFYSFHVISFHFISLEFFSFQFISCKLSSFNLFIFASSISFHSFYFDDLISNLKAESADDKEEGQRRLEKQNEEFEEKLADIKVCVDIIDHNRRRCVQRIKNHDILLF